MKKNKEQFREAYEIEKELAAILRNASKKERQNLYASVYNEFFIRVPQAPQTNSYKMHSLRNQMLILKPFLKKESVFAEIGAGNCRLSLEVSKYVKQVYAIEVSNEISKTLINPSNYELIIYNGTDLPLAKTSVNIIYSYQVMEHIHPEDALEQLQNIYKILSKKGIYICITPNRLYGPNDVSRNFDMEATGFHLKEYTIFELQEIFKSVGFSKIKLFVGGAGRYFILPTWPIILMEKFIIKLPYNIRKKFARLQPFRTLLHVRLIGIK